MWRTTMKLIVSGLVVALFVLISTYAVASEYQEVDAPAVKKMMDSGDVLVVFPLSPIEYNDLHIKDSINIPMSQLEAQLPEDKSQKIVFYCLGIKCIASWRAAERAAELGYKNVYAFREGLPAWVEAGYPTVTTDKIPDVEVNQITVAELSDKLLREPIVLIDINLEEDVEKHHIESIKRVQIPIDELHFRTSTLKKDKPIAVLCLKGERAPTATRYLIGKGFKNVVAVKGGMQQWILDGYPVSFEAKRQPY